MTPGKGTPSGAKREGNPQPEKREDDLEARLATPRVEVVPADDEPLPSYSLAEIKSDNYKPNWLVKDFWAHPSHGEIAGMEKALKSWMALDEAVSVASGRQFLGSFEVITPGPVVIFTGESGRHMCERRIRHIGRSKGLSDAKIDKLPIRVIDQIAPTRSEIFQFALDRELGRKPVLVLLDPLYAYHGGDVDAGNVHASTEVMNVVSNKTGEARASLKLVNHFRKSADGHLALSDISQAGHREWVESWVLVKHQKTPDAEDVRAGHFELEMAVGSRLWDGDAWKLEVEIGELNRTTWEYEGDVKWKVGRHAPQLAEVTDAVIGFLRGKGGEKANVGELREALKGHRDGLVSKAAADLAADPTQPVGVEIKGRSKRYWYDPNAVIKIGER